MRHIHSDIFIHDDAVVLVNWSMLQLGSSVSSLNISQFGSHQFFHVFSGIGLDEFGLAFVVSEPTQLSLLGYGPG